MSYEDHNTAHAEWNRNGRQHKSQADKETDREQNARKELLVLDKAIKSKKKDFTKVKADVTFAQKEATKELKNLRKTMKETAAAKHKTGDVLVEKEKVMKKLYELEKKYK